MCRTNIKRKRIFFIILIQQAPGFPPPGVQLREGRVQQGGLGSCQVGIAEENQHGGLRQGRLPDHIS